LCDLDFSSRQNKQVFILGKGGKLLNLLGGIRIF